MAKLYYRYGAMNSGKSLFLISTAYNFKTRGINYLVLKPSVDTRDINIKSRAMPTSLECIPINNTDDIVYIVLDYKQYDIQWILVDESQFLTKKQVDELAHLVDYFNINVICYGLRTDFKTNLFDGSRRLFEIADTIEEMKTTCECGKRAHINARVDKNGNILLDGEQVECGAEDKYITLCRKCFHKHILYNNSTQNKLNPGKNMEILNDNPTYNSQQDLNYNQTTCTNTDLNVQYVYESNKDINYVEPIGETLNSSNNIQTWSCPVCNSINTTGNTVCVYCGKAINMES